VDERKADKAAVISTSGKQVLCYSWHNTYSGNIFANVYWVIIISTLIKMFKGKALPAQALRIPGG